MQIDLTGTTAVVTGASRGIGLATVRALVAQGAQVLAGAIVNIASANAHLAQPVVVAYAASKAAMLNLGKALAEEFGPRGVRVNTISPGPVLTPLWTGADSPGAAMAAQYDLTTEELVEQLPQLAGMTTGAMAAPDEVAALVLLLASGAVPSMRGAELVLDGGLLKAI